MSERMLEVKNLNLWIDGDYTSKQILNDVSFKIDKGETLGIAGESGCGKSVTSLSIIRLLQSPPARPEGEILFHGENLLDLPMKKMRKIQGNKISMIFQEPMTSLNPLYSIGFQLMEPLRLHQGLTKEQAKEKAIEMLKLVRMSAPEKRLKQFPHELSGGMRQRVMIAMALACKPELLIADEPTTALDVTIQAQVLKLMKELQKEMGTAIAFITHDLGVIREMCDKVMIMYCGEVIEEAKTKDIFKNPKHPYTKGLLSTIPRYGIEGDLPTIPGMVPPAGKFPPGCCFAPRCKFATAKCRKNKPSMVSAGRGHMVKCFLFDGGTK